MFTPVDGDTRPLPYQSPLDLVKEVVRRFNPRQLSEPERAMDRDISPLEDQYSKEFYRCIDDVLKGSYDCITRICGQLRGSKRQSLFFHTRYDMGY